LGYIASIHVSEFKLDNALQIYSKILDVERQMGKEELSYISLITKVQISSLYMRQLEFEKCYEHLTELKMLYDRAFEPDSQRHFEVLSLYVACSLNEENIQYASYLFDTYSKFLTPILEELKEGEISNDKHLISLKYVNFLTLLDRREEAIDILDAVHEETSIGWEEYIETADLYIKLQEYDKCLEMAEKGKEYILAQINGKEDHPLFYNAIKYQAVFDYEMGNSLESMSKFPIK